MSTTPQVLLLQVIHLLLPRPCEMLLLKWHQAHLASILVGPTVLAPISCIPHSALVLKGNKSPPQKKSDFSSCYNTGPQASSAKAAMETLQGHVEASASAFEL